MLGDNLRPPARVRVPQVSVFETWDFTRHRLWAEFEDGESSVARRNTEKLGRMKKRMRLRASADEKLAIRLEDDLGCELHVEGFAGADTRGAVEVADGVAYETIRTHRAASRCQVDPVE